MSPHVSPRIGIGDDWAPDALRQINLLEALGIARRSVEHLTAQPFDSISASQRLDDGRWSVTVDMIETRARMGNNDLLSAYQVILAPDGELVGYSRLHRFHREDVYRS